MSNLTARVSRMGIDIGKTETIPEQYDRLNALGRNVTRYMTHGLGTCPRDSNHFDPDCIPPLKNHLQPGTTTHNQGLTFVMVGGSWRVISAIEASHYQDCKKATPRFTANELTILESGEPLSLGTRSIKVIGGCMRRHVELWFRWNLSGNLDASTQLSINANLSGDWSDDYFDNALQLLTPTGFGTAGQLQAFSQPFNLLSDEPIELRPRQEKQFQIELSIQLAKPYINHPDSLIESGTFSLYARSWNRTETI